MVTYKFKLYNSKKNKHINKQINIAGAIYNHCIALHSKYYKLFGKYLNYYTLKRHITKLKKRDEYKEWNELNSQAIQNIVERIDKAYKLFFRNVRCGIKTSPPYFKNVHRYKSFTLTQTGYKIFEDNRIQVGKRVYKYFKSREIKGEIKTVTIKRDVTGDIYVYITCEDEQKQKMPRTGISVGYDFGLNTFLTASDGQNIMSPEFFKQSQNKIRVLHKKLSAKRKGSNNYKRAKRKLAKAHRKVLNKRKDFHFKTALYIVTTYSVVCIESLDIESMKKFWGKKINDLGYSNFVGILKHQASKTGSTIVEIPKFYPSSKECSGCGHINKALNLKDRKWTCSVCKRQHDRDFNAALNIHRVGVSTLSE